MGKPRVLVIDDEVDEVRHLQVELQEDLSIEIVHPEDLTPDLATRADLFLIDFVLESWPERDAVDVVARKPRDGLAVAATLRSHAPTEGEPGSARAFALHSARLESLSSSLPTERREPVLARALNLEWIFQKGSQYEQIPITAQILSLASAVKTLPKAWPQDDQKKLQRIVTRFLRLASKVPWAERAWEDIEGSHPPIHELSEHSHGLAFIRWLLQRILPYPCFLWDIHYLAARLRVTTDTLRNALTSSTKFTSALEAYRYTGELASFVSPRYWRAGIEAFLWDVTGGQALEGDAIRKALKKIGGRSLEPVAMLQPVVCLNSDFTSLSEFHEAEECVRIHPDDWPPYADDAWTTIEMARGEPSLRSSVSSLDREKL